MSKGVYTGIKEYKFSPGVIALLRDWPSFSSKYKTEILEAYKRMSGRGKSVAKLKRAFDDYRFDDIVSRQNLYEALNSQEVEEVEVEVIDE